jgi:hypothetical protein
VSARVESALRSLALCVMLGASLGASARAFAQDEEPALEGEDGLGLEEEAPEEEAPPEAEPPPEEEAPLEPEAPIEEEAPPSIVEEPSVEEPAEPPEETPAPSRGVALQVGAGLGVGSLSFTRPIPEGVQRLPQTPFAAAELFVRVHIAPKATLSLQTLVAYQSSLGLALRSEPLFGLPEEVPVRSQRLELSVAPVLRLADSASAVTLAFPLGFAFRSVSPEAHQYRVLAHAFGGPLLRAELSVPLTELIRLRGGPELEWIVMIDPSLRREKVCCQGVAWGGHAAVEARVGEIFSVALAYRESRAAIPVIARFEEVERLLTARFSGEL